MPVVRVFSEDDITEHVLITFITLEITSSQLRSFANYWSTSCKEKCIKYKQHLMNISKTTTSKI